MNCPYCNYNKTDRKKESGFGTYTCPKCDYLFEVSAPRVILDLTLSIPFSSIIYTPIFLVVNYFIAVGLFVEESSLLPFGVFLMFLLVLTSLLLVFVFYMISGRSSRIFIVDPHQEKSFITTIKRIHPLIKISIYLVVASIFAAIFIPVPF